MPRSFERRLFRALGAGPSAFWRIDVAPLGLARLSGPRDAGTSWSLRPWERRCDPLDGGSRIAALAVLGTAPGEAHRIAARGGPPPEGISIPSLTHGQMAVISDNLSAIRALAGARIGFDMTTWRLEDYLNIQSFACFWGVGSRQHRGRGEPVQRMRPRLSRRRAGAAAAIALDAGRRPQGRRCPCRQDRRRDAGQGRVAHVVPLQRRALQYQRSHLSAMERNSEASADSGIRPHTFVIAIGGAAWGAWPRRSGREMARADA